MNWTEVREAPDYRSFLKAYLKEKGLNLSDLARSSGFARGCTSDILTGRRRLTHRTFFAFEKSLKLPAAGKRLFRLLVAQAEPQLLPELATRDLAGEILRLREAPWSKVRREVESSISANVHALVRNQHVLKVFAAAGEPGRGATVAEIQRRTQLPAPAVLAAIKALLSLQLLKLNNSHYEPQDLHLFIQAKQQDEFVATRFRQACQAATHRAESALSSKSEFFFTSTFLVSESRLPELKEALRRTVLQYIDESITADGDRLVQFVASMHL